MTGVLLGKFETQTSTLCSVILRLEACESHVTFAQLCPCWVFVSRVLPEPERPEEEKGLASCHYVPPSLVLRTQLWHFLLIGNSSSVSTGNSNLENYSTWHYFFYLGYCTVLRLLTVLTNNIKSFLHFPLSLSFVRNLKSNHTILTLSRILNGLGKLLLQLLEIEHSNDFSKIYLNTTSHETRYFKSYLNVSI